MTTSLRGHSEDDLPARLAALEQALDASSTAIWRTDLSTGQVVLSRNWAAMLGGDPAETHTTVDALVGLVHPDDLASLLRAQKETIRGIRPHYVAEHRVQMRSGAWKWVLSRGSVTARNPETGHALRMAGTNVDITERKRLEDELTQSKAQRQQILDSVPVEIAYVDCDERFNFVNRPFLERRGLAESEVLGRTLRESFGERTYATLRPYVQIALSGRPARFGFETQDHSGRPYEFSMQYIPDRKGEEPVRGFFYLAIDVTERNRAERGLQEAKAAAEQANRAKSDFLSSMSHELRTPLGTILGFGQLLEEEPGAIPEEPHRQWLASMVKAGWHLLGLVNDVLDLARIEAGRVELALQPVALDDLVDECHREIHPAAAKRNIRIETQAPPVRARADPMRLRQVLLNLLSNAVKYNRDEGNVRIAVSVAGGVACLAVSDDGPGIAPERRSELFQPFKRLGAERSKVEGYGFGLSIARRLVELMGGTIRVTSEPGQGSTFTIEVPLAEDTPDEEAPAEESTGASDALSRITATILCVEDDPANQKLVQAVVSRWGGVRLLLAQDGRKGLATALEARPDLILLDIDLPGLNGYDILRVLRERDDTRHIPVIGLSARAMPADMQRAMGESFHAYLTKPYQIAELQASIESALEKARR